MDIISAKSETGQPELYSIVAMGLDNAIGLAGRMPWHLPEDLRHFKQLTLGHPVIMGRSTWESLPKRPLPGRLNVVISRNPSLELSGALKASTPQEALRLCADRPEIPFIIGGGRIYAETLPLVSKIFVTRINASFPEADTFFPPIPEDEWEITDRSEIMISKTGLQFWFETYERRNRQ